jgi:hypothetical protein
MVLPIYQKLAVFALLTSIGGEYLVYFFKKLLVDKRVGSRVEFSGMLERTILLLCIVYGGLMLWLIPLVILIRAIFVLTKANFVRFSGLLNRKEPSLEFQKIRLKSELLINLLLSPALGILFASIAKVL